VRFLPNRTGLASPKASGVTEYRAPTALVAIPAIAAVLLLSREVLFPRLDHT
jgi:hypothetical protein